MRFDDIDDDSELEGRFSRGKVKDVLTPSNSILSNPSQAIDLVGRIIGQAQRSDDGEQTITVWDLRKHWLNYLRSLEEIEIPGHIDFYRTAMQLCDKMADRSLVSLLHGKTILGIGGQFSAGKSAFINAVVGLNGLLPEEQSPTTSIPTFVTKGAKTEYLLTSMKGRVTREISATELNALSHAFYERYKISFSAFVDSCIISSPDFRISPDIVLLDTPGYSKPDDLERTFTLSDRERALEQLKRADRLIWLIQQENGTIPAEDLKFINDVNPSQPILIIITHADQVGDTNMAEIIKNVTEMAVGIPGGVYGVTGYSSPLAKEYKNGHLIEDFLKDVTRTDNRKGDIVHQFDLLEQQILNAAVGVEAELKGRVRELKKYIANTTEVLAMRSLSILMVQSIKRLKLVRMAIKQQNDGSTERKTLVQKILAGGRTKNEDTSGQLYQSF